MRVTTKASNCKSETHLNNLPDVCCEACNTSTGSSLSELIIWIHRYLLDADENSTTSRHYDEDSDEYLTSIISTLEDMHIGSEIIKQSFKKLVNIHKKIAPNGLVSRFQNTTIKNEIINKNKLWTDIINFKRSINEVLQNECLDKIITDILHMALKTANTKVKRYLNFSNITHNILTPHMSNTRVNLGAFYNQSEEHNLDYSDNFNSINKQEIKEFNTIPQIDLSSKILYLTTCSLNEETTPISHQNEVHEKTTVTTNDSENKENPEVEFAQIFNEIEKNTEKNNSNLISANIPTLMRNDSKTTQSECKILNHNNTNENKNFNSLSEVHRIETIPSQILTSRFISNRYNIPYTSLDKTSNTTATEISLKVIHTSSKSKNDYDLSKTKVWIGGKWYLQGNEGLIPAYNTNKTVHNLGEIIYSEDKYTKALLSRNNISNPTTHLSALRTNCKFIKVWFGGKWYLQDEQGCRIAYTSV